MNWIERGWYNTSKLNYILLPLTALFWILSSVRKVLFKLGVIQQVASPLPVIVVGNISVGGTGKTPFVIYLVELLKQQGFKPAIVSRGYGAKDNKQQPFPRLITHHMAIEFSGDEPKLLALRTQCPVVISPDRASAVQYVYDNTDANIVISDDGLQHYKMSRDVEIVLLDAKRMFGNGWLLPVGPLRELPSRLRSVDLTLINAGSVAANDIAFEKSSANNGNSHKNIPDYQLLAEQAYNLKQPTTKLEPDVNVHLISGIGNPQRFADSVKSMGYQIESATWFADHHQFVQSDFTQFNKNEIIVMTEKDAVKCQQFAQDNWFVLPISAVISPKIESQLMTILQPLKNGL